MPQYNQKSPRKLFKDLPETLKESILSGAEKTVSDISRRHQVERRKISQLTELVRNVLLGNLSPEELPGTLKRKLQIEGDKAQKISREVNRFIILPAQGKTPEKPFPQKEKGSPKDTYREPIE